MADAEQRTSLSGTEQEPALSDAEQKPALSDAERKRRIAELLAELKELQATPRSDWHAGFEALLRIETHKFGSRVQIKTEHLLGEEPPRADFVVLIDEEGLLAGKSVFRIFLKHNIF